jgi:hypothetical protein
MSRNAKNYWIVINGNPVIPESDYGRYTIMTVMVFGIK